MPLRDSQVHAPSEVPFCISIRTHLEGVVVDDVADVDDQVEEVERQPAEAVQHRDRHQHYVGAPSTRAVRSLQCRGRDAVTLKLGCVNTLCVTQQSDGNTRIGYKMHDMFFDKIDPRLHESHLLGRGCQVKLSKGK